MLKSIVLSRLLTINKVINLRLCKYGSIASSALNSRIYPEYGDPPTNDRIGDPSTNDIIWDEATMQQVHESYKKRLETAETIKSNNSYTYFQFFHINNGRINMNFKDYVTWLPIKNTCYAINIHSSLIDLISCNSNLVSGSSIHTVKSIFAKNNFIEFDAYKKYKTLRDIDQYEYENSFYINNSIGLIKQIYPSVKNFGIINKFVTLLEHHVDLQHVKKHIEKRGKIVFNVEVFNANNFHECLYFEIDFNKSTYSFDKSTYNFD